MKNSTIKSIALINMILMLLLILCVPVMAAETQEKIILKKSEKEYLVYYKDMCDENFEFAFATDENADVNTLTFTSSAKDQIEDESKAKNIAYIDESFYDTYFQADQKAYIWIRNNEDEMIVEGDLIELEDSLTDELIEDVSNTTKRIKIDSSKTVKTTENVNGVETTITKGKVLIQQPKENAKYSYLILKATDESSKAGQLYTLAEKIDSIDDTYEKLEAIKEFNSLYNELMPSDSEWQEVKDLETGILQPEDAENGDKYVIYLKEVTAENEETIDVHCLVSVREEEQGKDQKEETVTEVVKLPVTFDSGTILFIVLGVIAVALVVLLVIKRKQNRE